MKKSWNLTAKILNGEKNIESRWYNVRQKPWNIIKKGEEIYFKDSGEPVTVKAEVLKVEQYKDLNKVKIKNLLKKYRKNLGINEFSKEIEKHIKNKRYCIIIHLTNPKKVEPFNINKAGYGNMAAWISTKSLEKIKRK